jgi:hypothetical protein
MLGFKSWVKGNKQDKKDRYVKKHQSNKIPQRTMDGLSGI